MTSSHTIKGAIALTLLLVLVSTASAEIIVTTYEHDTGFNAAFQETLACSCGTTTDYFLLENFGDFPAKYELSLENAPGYVTLHQSTYYLEPGQGVKVPVTIQAPCDEEIDTSYRVRAESQFGRFRAADRSLRVTTCDTLKLDVVQEDDSVLPCTPARFTIDVTNVGSYPETYVLRSSPDETTLSEETLVIPPGETRTAFMSVLFSCDVYGEQEIVVEAEALSNGVREKEEHLLYITPDYEFSVDMAGSIEVCAETTSTRTLVITNEASTTNTYTLDARHELFVLSEEEVVLAPGDAKAVTITFTPEESDVLVVDTKVVVTEGLSGQQKSVDTKLVVTDCYEQETSITPTKESYCAGTSEFIITSVNTGLSKESFTYEVSGGDLVATISDSYLELRPGEQGSVGLSIGVPDRNDDYEVVLKVTQSPGITEEYVVPITSLSNSDCTLAAIAHTKQSVYYDVSTVPVIVENKGIEAAQYSVEYSGTLFVAEENTLFLAPGEQGVIHLTPNDLEGLSEGTYIERLVLTSDRSEYRHDFEFKLKEKGVFTTFWHAMKFGPAGSMNLCLVLFMILFVVLIALVVAYVLVVLGIIDLERRDLEEKKKNLVTYIFAGVIILCIVFAVICAALTTPPETLAEEPLGSDYGMLYHEFTQNKVGVIDLGQYFVDPDGETLSYSVSPTENLDVRVKGSEAQIKPKWNFAGTEQIVFTATDSQGASVDSPIMAVRYLALEPISWIDTIIIYCKLFNWLLLALIFAILLIALHTLPEHHWQERFRKQVKKAFGVEVETLPVTTERVPATRPAQPTAVVGGDVVQGNKITVIGKKKEELYVGSTGGKTVHRLDCPTVRRIPKEKRQTFTSKADALKDGKTACKMCRAFEE